MKRYLPFTAVAALVILSGCGGGNELEDHTDSGPPTVVRTFKAEAQLAEEPVEYSASVEPADEANIAGKVMGRIEKFYVREGDTVKRGQLLVELEGEDVKARLAQASAGVADRKSVV